ncbi:hypothetical protein [Tenacibaculum sp. M341]|uniref:hypothetical protein n=1 Tax=Tenacibaculum sp. M341 TaxID=2530339 RepID=UPI0010470829|nr:hypothetical protein [Tenacibaculum sp. M341]TCI84981.1 hypothetical protein EYW44_19105 [Tenacibaculum sp. M341]
MKILFKITFIVYLILNSCAAQKQETNSLHISKLTYKAMTRGNFENISITGNNISHTTPSLSNKQTLSDQKLKEINDLVSKLNLETLSKIKAQTNKRLYDGAMNTSISIKVDNKTYTSSNFDHDAPPKELQPLIHLLRSCLK